MKKDKQIITKITKEQWINRWASSNTFISCSYWGPQYYDSLNNRFGVHFDKRLFIHRKGTAAFFVPEKEFRKLGLNLAKRSQRNSEFAKKVCKDLKSSTDILMPIMKSFEKKIPNKIEYSKFARAFDEHLALHVFVKKTIDFLDSKNLEKLLPYFKDARIYSEDIYTECEVMFRKIMKIIGKREGYNVEDLTCLTRNEFEEYLETKTLPFKSELKNRYSASALYFEGKKLKIFYGSDVDKIDSLIRAPQELFKVNGISAFPGKVRGKVRVILDPQKFKVFEKGDILVTGMTRPEFMKFVTKASAIVTDVGGVLCHAAITAREIHKICIVGTGTATKVFKDGDLVEVDANRGIVRKLNN